jgi:hypothetical protein
MRYIRVNGERASVPDSYEAELQITLDALSSLELPADRIYNWDETALFYRAMPNYTLAVHGEDDGAGAKENKLRITAMLSVNGDGSDKELVLIGNRTSLVIIDF